MGIVQVNDVITPDAPTPFLTFKRGSTTQAWEGLFALNYRIHEIDPDLAPTALWPVENIILHTAGIAQQMSFLQDGRLKKGISIPGRLCFYPRNQFIKTSWKVAGEFVAFGVSKQLMQEVAAEARKGDPDNIQLEGLGIFDDPMLTQIGWTLLSLLQDTGSSGRLYAEALGISLAHHLLRHYDPNGRKLATKGFSAIHHRQIQAAVDYIHAHYPQDLSLTELAVAANLSVAHFTRLFRKFSGCTPYAYLIQYRVKQSFLLFQQRRYSGAEIAELVGFYDESHLIRYFKRIYGTTPARLFH